MTRPKSNAPKREEKQPWKTPGKRNGKEVIRDAKAQGQPSPDEAPLADDLLEGADTIAAFIFGDPGQRRRIYWLAERQSLPCFRLGLTICCRRSTLRAWIAQQEEKGLSK